MAMGKRKSWTFIFNGGGRPVGFGWSGKDVPSASGRLMGGRYSGRTCRMGGGYRVVNGDLAVIFFGDRGASPIGR